MKQTAVEWLIMDYVNKGIITIEAIEQAQKMEKEQIIDAYLQGADIGEMFNNENRAFNTDADKYYKETYKSE